jgi:hypothetical protein
MGGLEMEDGWNILAIKRIVGDIAYSYGYGRFYSGGIDSNPHVVMPDRTLYVNQDCFAMTYDDVKHLKLQFIDYD